MNSEIFVQAPTTIPALETKKSRPDSSASVPSQGRAAVIRPVRMSGRGGGRPQSESGRLDGGTTSIPQPNQRKERLAEYVKSLNASLSREAPSQSRGAQTSEAAPLSEHELISSFVPKGGKTAPPSPRSVERVDGAHAGVSQPKIDPVVFQEEAERIARLKELIAANQARMAKETSAESFESVPAELPEVVLPEPQQSVPAAPPVPENPNDRSQLDSDSIIRTVAQAIASVLTDQTEAEIESKIRSHLGDSVGGGAAGRGQAATSPTLRHDGPETTERTDRTTQRILQAITSFSSEPSEPRSSIEQPTVVAAEQPEAGAPETGLPEMDVAGHESEEIPEAVAAWEVPDFRWPAVSNHMVTHGGRAIEQLARSVSGLQGNMKRLVVTSPGRGEGTTSIAISLARWVAATGKDVLLIDADLASPGLSSQVGLGPGISWFAGLQEGLAPSEMMVQAQESGICVMPLAPIESRATCPRFILDQLGALVRQVESCFDLIVIDVGPVSQLTSELSLPSLMADAGLLVYNEAGTSNFAAAKTQLQQSGLSRFVIAQNSVKQPANKVA